MVAVPWVKLGASSDESDTLVDTAPLALPTFSRTDFSNCLSYFCIYHLTRVTRVTTTVSEFVH